jgi:hypothetical protein
MLEQFIVAAVLIFVVIIAGIGLYRQLTGKGNKCGCCSGKCTKINDYLELTNNSKSLETTDNKDKETKN